MSQQVLYERAVVNARSVIAKHFVEDNRGLFLGDENFTVQCDEIGIPQAGSLAYSGMEAEIGREIPCEKIKEQKDPPPTNRRIFVIGIGKKVTYGNSAKSGSYFLKVQLSNEKKECPITVVIVGSKIPHNKTQKFQGLLGNDSNLLLNYPLGELSRILRAVVETYGNPREDRQKEKDSIL